MCRNSPYKCPRHRKGRAAPRIRDRSGSSGHILRSVGDTHERQISQSAQPLMSCGVPRPRTIFNGPRWKTWPMTRCSMPFALISNPCHRNHALPSHDHANDSGHHTRRTYAGHVVPHSWHPYLPFRAVTPFTRCHEFAWSNEGSHPVFLTGHFLSSPYAVVKGTRSPARKPYRLARQCCARALPGPGQ